MLTPPTQARRSTHQRGGSRSEQHRHQHTHRLVSKGVTAATNAGGATGFGSVDDEDASWSGTALQFPRIQGADVCGRVVEVGRGVPAERIGERVLVRTMLRSYVDYRPFECWTLGSECDGSFAQYVVAPARETYAVDCDWSDIELAAVPCAYSTAENMLHRTAVTSERVLITGASGGVGLAAVQLAKRRGATVIAVCSADKATDVTAHGADQIIERGTDLVDALGAASVDVVIDLVAGPQWPQPFDVLRTGGRYAVAGAVGGPIAEIDVRTLYLKDQTLHGAPSNLTTCSRTSSDISSVTSSAPVVSATYPLSDIVRAQEDFLARKHIGKLVLIPPSTP